MNMGDVDRDLTLDHGTACARCSYDLGGLKADGICPECGYSVQVTIVGDYLRFDDRVWRESLLKQGEFLRKLFIFVVACLILWLLNSALVFATLASLSQWSVVDDDTKAQKLVETLWSGIIFVFYALLTTLLPVGAWKASTPLYKTFRVSSVVPTMIRVCVVVSLVGTTIWCVSIPLDSSPMIMSGVYMTFALPIGLFFLLRGHARLARALPDASLADAMLSRSWLFVLGILGVPFMLSAWRRYLAAVRADLEIHAGD
ncbi:MAG: hypothetical protein AAGB34_02425 [Planctomycetota bacterium]